MPLRRSSLAVETIPNRKAFIPEQQEETAEEHGSPEPIKIAHFTPEVKLAAGNPANLPNRKAFIPSHAGEADVKDAKMKLAAFDIPNRKAYVFPDALAPKSAAGPSAEIKQIHPASLPNRKAYVFPEVKTNDENDTVTHQQPAVLAVHPASLPNRKAYVFPEAPASSAQVKAADPFAGNNRKAFITDEDAGVTHSEDIAPEDEDFSPAATPMAVKNIDPFSLPNRKAFLPSSGSGADKKEAQKTGEAAAKGEFEAAKADEAKFLEGTAIPLRKRQINPLANAGVLNWDAAEVGQNTLYRGETC